MPLRRGRIPSLNKEENVTISPDREMAKGFVYSSTDSVVPKDLPRHPIRAMVDKTFGERPGKP
jgi:hypothetical protein